MLKSLEVLVEFKQRASVEDYKQVINKVLPRTRITAVRNHTAIMLFGQLVALYHRAHRAIQYQDALLH